MMENTFGDAAEGQNPSVNTRVGAGTALGRRAVDSAGLRGMLAALPGSGDDRPGKEIATLGRIAQR